MAERDTQMTEQAGERDGYPAGVPCWIDTTQPDAEAAVAFYGELFGWELEDRMPAGSPERYFIATLDGRMVAAISSASGDAPGGAAAWNTYVAVESADSAAAAAEAAGGSVLMAPFDVGPAGRMAALADPAGAEFRIWQAGTNRGAQIVNAPGAWNWSDLLTTDIEGAKTFYGAVFGWETDTLDFGAGTSTMIRVPGYGATLAQHDTDMLERQEELGAPAGFEDAIGWIEPAGDGPPRWRVTFSVADADDTAARTAQLGGEVLIEPHNVPYVRAALLKDPQGGVFAIGEFRPDQR
jgi:predicted enzyme related to lactoylglutathione lyase